MESTPQHKNDLEELRSHINLAEITIQHEFDTSENTWLECLASMVALVDVYLALPRVQEHLQEEELVEAKKRLEKLEEERRALLKKYPSRAKNPPKKIQQDLIRKLNVFI